MSIVLSKLDPKFRTHGIFSIAFQECFCSGKISYDISRCAQNVWSSTSTGIANLLSKVRRLSGWILFAGFFFFQHVFVIPHGHCRSYYTPHTTLALYILGDLSVRIPIYIYSVSIVYVYYYYTEPRYTPQKRLPPRVVLCSGLFVCEVWFLSRHDPYTSPPGLGTACGW